MAICSHIHTDLVPTKALPSLLPRTRMCLGHQRLHFSLTQAHLPALPWDFLDDPEVVAKHLRAEWGTFQAKLG